MTEHYNAFISYRHTPHDSKVAETIQKQLEHFKIPKAIQKSHNIKKIDRIFRDKEELPITSNLNETIENALNNSDYLIVICSHAMLESIWVKREIDFFLKTHTKKQILTVIAEGEPVDVLPEILKTDEIEITNEDGTKEMISIPAEPLSCDYRLPIKKAKKEELPRLAAALIGCSYDGLRQRQRQYRMRRLAIAGTATAAALVGLTTYFAWSAVQIKENYIASLKNQSAYLSAEANRLYDNGDRLSAMLLALEALPSEGDDRPVIPEAVDAIVRSTYAYQYPGSNIRTLDTSYTHKGMVNEFTFDSTNKYMYVRHSRYSVSFWDTETHDEFFSKTYSNLISGIQITSQDHLLVWGSDMFECLDGKTGEVLWAYDNPVSTNISYHEATNQAAIVAYSIGEDFHSELQISDAEDGTILYSRPQEIVIDDIEYDLYPICFNTTGNILAVQISSFQSNEVRIGFWNLVEDSFTYTTTSVGINQDIFVDAIESGTFVNEHTFVLVSPINAPYTMQGYSYISTERGQDYHIFGDTRMLLRGYDTDCNLLWSTEHPYALLYSGSTLDTLDYTDGEVTIPAFIFSTGNKSGIYDIETGTLLDSITTSDCIVHSIYGDGVNTFFLRNGMNGGWNISNGLYSEMESTISNVGIAYYSDRLYVCEDDSHQILSYQKKVYDKNWESMTVLPFLDDIYHLENGTLIISDATQDEQKTLLITYLTIEGLLWQKELSRNYYNYKYIGSDNENVILAYDGYDENNNHIIQLEYWNLATGEISNIIDFSDKFAITPYIQYVDGNYICDDSYTNENDPLVKRYVLVDSEFNVISDFNTNVNSSDIDFSVTTIQSCNPDGSALILKGDKELILLTKELCTSLCSIDGSLPSLYSWSETNNSVAIVFENVIQVFNKDGLMECEISNNGRKPLSIQFYDDNLLVAYENGVLRRYSSTDGTYLSETNLKMGSMPRLDEIVWDFSEDELWIIIDEELNIIDTTTWKPETTVSNCIGFDIENQTLFLIGWEDGMYETEEKCISKFKRYTVDELIERAKEQLGSVELTDEQKALYGLS